MHFVGAHYHCHAPTCLKMEIYNNITGELLCREVPYHGLGADMKPNSKDPTNGPRGDRFDEPGVSAAFFSQCKNHHFSMHTSWGNHHFFEIQNNSKRTAETTTFTHQQNVHTQPTITLLSVIALTDCLPSQYIAQRICLWGNESYGLEKPPKVGGVLRIATKMQTFPPDVFY